MKDTTEGRMMQDKIEKIGKTIIQHGKTNNRIYLMKLLPAMGPTLFRSWTIWLRNMATQKFLQKFKPMRCPIFISEQL